jgi:NAD(P)-dependent dehydrogenase (short-subunit alcohol dehydrogenase family)
MPELGTKGFHVPDTLRVAVTAGASGIGLAIAREFLQAGADVWVCDIDPEAIQRASQAVPGLRAACADVADSPAITRALDAARSDMGGIDVLVNNAGIAGPTRPTEEITTEEWQRCFAVNVEGTFNCCRAVIPAMKAQRSGCIINISTANVRTALPLRSAYVASKYAVHGITANLARELGPHGIRCNAILPGPIDNPRGRLLIRQRALDSGITVQEAEARALAHVSLRSWIDPAEVGKTAVFLSSLGGRSISGQFIGVCGNAEWDG